MRGSWIQSGFGTVASVVAESQREKEASLTDLANRLNTPNSMGKSRRRLPVTSFSAGQSSQTDQSPSPTAPMECLQCRDWFVPVDGVNAVWAGGCWWCKKHANLMFVVNGSVGDKDWDCTLEVVLPSGGRLRPESVYGRQ